MLEAPPEPSDGIDLCNVGPWHTPRGARACTMHALLEFVPCVLGTCLFRSGRSLASQFVFPAGPEEGGVGHEPRGPIGTAWVFA